MLTTYLLRTSYEECVASRTVRDHLRIVSAQMLSEPLALEMVTDVSQNLTYVNESISDCARKPEAMRIDHLRMHLECSSYGLLLRKLFHVAKKGWRLPNKRYLLKVMHQARRTSHQSFVHFWLGFWRRIRSVCSEATCLAIVSIMKLGRWQSVTALLYVSHGHIDASPTLSFERRIWIRILGYRKRNGGRLSKSVTTLDVLFSY